MKEIVESLEKINDSLDLILNESRNRNAEMKSISSSLISIALSLEKIAAPPPEIIMLESKKPFPKKKNIINSFTSWILYYLI